MQQPLPKIRVLHVIPNFGVGGAEMLVKNLLLSYDKRKFEVAACSLFPKRGTIIDRELEEKGIRVFYLNKKLGPDPNTLINLYHLFKQYKVNIIHTHSYVLRYTLLPSIICRVPVKVHTVHNIAKKEVDLPGKFIHWLAFKLFGVTPFGISKEISKTIEALYKLKSVPYIYNGIPIINIENGSEVRNGIRASLCIEEEQPVIINVGRFAPQKNHKLLLSAFKRVLAVVPNVLLLLVGEGGLKSDMQNYARIHSLNNSVKFLGLRADVSALLSAADMFVLSSDWEGVPLVVLEAMAAGKPVVATAVGGVPELIINRENGLLVQPNDAIALSNAMLSIINTPEMAQRMGNAGRVLAEQNYDKKVMTKFYEDYYLRLYRDTAIKGIC